jgi:pimeloyl-ACP methyl ester carboxylesterase
MSGKIYASGVSRGAYFALRLAAADPRIKGVAGLAPVTDWRKLREFAQVRESPDVAGLALENWAASLATKPVYLAIGNRDNRVGTIACIRLAQRLLENQAVGDGAVPTIELHVADSPGHALTEDWRIRGADFLLALSETP